VKLCRSLSRSLSLSLALSLSRSLSRSLSLSLPSLCAPLLADTVCCRTGTYLAFPTRYAGSVVYTTATTKTQKYKFPPGLTYLVFPDAPRRPDRRGSGTGGRGRRRGRPAELWRQPDAELHIRGIRRLVCGRRCRRCAVFDLDVGSDMFGYGSGGLNRVFKPYCCSLRFAVCCPVVSPSLSRSLCRPSAPHRPLPQGPARTLLQVE
jgi:hypothetical protein